MQNKLTERDKLIDKVQNLSVDEIADMFLECYDREQRLIEDNKRLAKYYQSENDRFEVAKQALKAEHRKVLEAVREPLVTITCDETGEPDFYSMVSSIGEAVSIITDSLGKMKG